MEKSFFSTNWIEKAKSHLQENFEDSQSPLFANKNSLNMQDEDQIKKAWENIKKHGYNNSSLMVKQSELKGLGVFTKKNISKGEIIELTHAIVLDWKKKYTGDFSILKYAYWKPCNCNECRFHGETGMILLGNGSIYNSAEKKGEENAGFFLYPKISLGIFVAVKDIEADQEILTWWGQQYYDSWCKKQSPTKGKI